MGFVVWRTGDLNTNERMVSFYKKELWASWIIETRKLQNHYGTKYYRRVKFKNPSGRLKRRIKALVSHAYRTKRKEYEIKAQLWARI